MKNRTVHVIDPLFALGRAADFVSTHGPNITKLQNALAKCWLPDWDGWKQNFVLPIDAPDASKQSGLICLMAVRDFDGTEIRQSYNDSTDKLAGFRVNMLYELMSIEQNGAKLPEAFIHSVDD
ncbi:hypothetical protein E2562_036301 [Oryza meyeriana var. granulata]|uniref:Uncharacterized protein n=1 Tax=Oryza meyeriana var. granulata TaxID=110450 RepID=A0A6G1DS59_9ORYZ|nr:hypothetical protein E2562_036301 [Oryza meyeriana var. granulata]